jgi:flavin-dependent dehydrogenase
MTVRAEFDEYCLARTVEWGAELRVIPHLRSITEREDEVQVQTSAGLYRARYLVGADGANSVVRRLAGLGPVPHGFALEAQVALCTPPPMELDIGVVERGYGWLFPKSDHVNVGLYTSDAAVPIERTALDAYARAKLGAVTLTHVVGHYIGLHGWRQRVASSRVVLAGDAAGLVDPLLGEGIHNAVASGQAAAAAIRACRTMGKTLALAYARELRPLVRDLKVCARTAALFYARPDIGYRILATRPLGTGLVRGFARGLSFSAARRRLLLPFLTS